MSKYKDQIENEILEIVGALQPVPSREIRLELVAKASRGQLPDPPSFKIPVLGKVFRRVAAKPIIAEQRFGGAYSKVWKLERQGFLTSEVGEYTFDSGKTIQVPYYSRTGKRKPVQDSSKSRTATGIFDPAPRLN